MDPATPVNQNPAGVITGSTLYYATLYLPIDVKSQVQLIHILHREITGIPASCSDPGIARIKLDWWREEQDRIQHRQARHPLGKQLQQAISEGAIESDYLTRLIEAGAEQLVPPHIDRHADWAAFMDNGPALAWHSTARLCGFSDPASGETIEDLIRMCVWIELLQDTYPLAGRGQCLFSNEHLEKSGLKRNDLISHPCSNAVIELLRSEYDQVREHVQTGYRTLPAPDRRRQLPVLILSRLVHALCREILKSGPPDPRQRTALTPLRRFWISWLTRLTTR
ncbi:MAG: squalene/phytoene synthase family protein [Thiotrichales bacterium]|nr:squalene/phytoene synthase family protein [Thiotrichales bacterium]